MKNALSAYKGTSVHWGKSQADIQRMLNDKGIYDIQFTNLSRETAERYGLKMEADHFAIVLTFQKQETLPNGVAGNIPVRIVIPNVPNDNKSMNQYYRVLYWYLKSKFEAVDTGLVEFAEEFMAHLQITKSGSISRLWDTFKGGYYRAIGSGEQGDAKLLPPMEDDSEER